MNIVVGLGDIGGQRALFPLLEKIALAGHRVFILNHRFDIKEIEKIQSLVEVVSADLQAIDIFIKEKNINAYLFSTSVADKFGVELAEHLRGKFSIPSICILDNWMNYKVRMELGGGKYHYPTIYCVMDDLAKSEAIKAGIPKECLKITGLSGMKQIDQTVSEQTLKINSNKKILLFINEPASSDQGVDDSSPKFRGYHEYEVMEHLFNRNQEFFKKYKILVCPHPRDDVDKLSKYLKTLEKDLDISFPPPGNSLHMIPVASGVIGMASIFLFYSWLYHIPTLSYQPNVRLSDLKLLSKRDGIIFLTQFEKLKSGLKILDSEVQDFEFKIENKRKIFYDYITPPHEILEILGNL